MSLRSRVAFAFIFLSLCLSNAASSLAKVNRHDTIIMKNGDRLTGEVKRLDEGILYVQTDYFAGSVGLDWLQVEKVESKATFQIVLSSGKRLTGSISKVEAAAAPGKDVIVRAEGVEVPVAGTDVVQIESQKQNFWRQLKGSIDLGYNYTSGNGQSSLNSSASAEYPATHWAAELPTQRPSAGKPVAPPPTSSKCSLMASVFLIAIPTSLAFRISSTAPNRISSCVPPWAAPMAASSSAIIATPCAGLPALTIRVQVINPVSLNLPSKTWNYFSAPNISSSSSIATRSNRKFWFSRACPILAASASQPRTSSASSSPIIST